MWRARQSADRTIMLPVAIKETVRLCTAISKPSAQTVENEKHLTVIMQGERMIAITAETLKAKATADSSKAWDGKIIAGSRRPGAATGPIAGKNKTTMSPVEAQGSVLS